MKITLIRLSVVVRCRTTGSSSVFDDEGFSAQASSSTVQAEARVRRGGVDISTLSANATKPGVDLIRDGREENRAGDVGQRLALGMLAAAERHRARHVHHDHDVHLAFGVRVAHERRAHASRHVPVDAADVVARPVRLVLVEVEARAAQRALVGADALVADLAPRRHLDVAQLAHHVLGDHGIGTAAAAPAGSRRRGRSPAWARTVRAMRCRVASEKISFTSSRQHIGAAVQERVDAAQRQQVLVRTRRNAEQQQLLEIAARRRLPGSRVARPSRTMYSRILGST